MCHKKSHSTTGKIHYQLSKIHDLKIITNLKVKLAHWTVHNLAFWTENTPSLGMSHQFEVNGNSGTSKHPTQDQCTGIYLPHIHFYHFVRLWFTETLPNISSIPRIKPQLPNWKLGTMTIGPPPPTLYINTTQACPLYIYCYQFYTLVEWGWNLLRQYLNPPWDRPQHFLHCQYKKEITYYFDCRVIWWTPLLMSSHVHLLLSDSIPPDNWLSNRIPPCNFLSNRNSPYN